jgi:hypothetical protein
MSPLPLLAQRMKLRSIVLSLVFAALLEGCATAHNYPPTPVIGKPDTQEFKVYMALGTPESEADRVAALDFEAFKQKNGYRAFSIVEKRWNHLPTYFAYTVRFER